MLKSGVFYPRERYWVLFYRTLFMTVIYNCTYQGLIRRFAGGLRGVKFAFLAESEYHSSLWQIKASYSANSNHQ